MKSTLKERIVDISQREIVKPSVSGDVKNIVASLFGWKKPTPVFETFENRVNESCVKLSPLKQHEEGVANSLHRYRDFHKRHIPYNQRM